MSHKLHHISLVIPVYNEEPNIQWFYEELTGIMQSIENIDYEILYVNDGSTDATGKLLTAIASDDTHISYICMARNFGKEAATSAGLHYASGDAVILLDGDGQHPPGLIHDMITAWEHGVQQVVGIRTSNGQASFLKKAGSKVFYFLSKKLGANTVIANATDFRLIDRELVDVFQAFKERKRMTRALLDWSGFTTEYIYFKARDREHGVATYNIKALTRLAVNGYISATLKPLYFVGAFGLFITVLMSLALTLLTLNKFVFNDPLQLGISGSAIITLFVTLLVGILMMSQGIVAIYVANIHLEAQNRPLYIINKAKSRMHATKGDKHA